MRIEMVGPPASGKSTIVRALVNLGVKEGPRGNPGDIPKGWHKFAKYIVGSYKGTSHENTRLPTKSLEGLAAAWVGDNSSVPMVFDELVILNGFSLATRYPYRAKRYFEQCPLPAILVSLNADDDVFRKRGDKRELRSGKGRYEKSLRFKYYIDIYLPLLKERGCNVLEFDTGRMKKSRIANEVYDEVLRLQNRKRKRKQ
jgi:hypothetical protein